MNLADALFGFLVGLAVAPALRAWVLWRQWKTASREAEEDRSRRTLS